MNSRARPPTWRALILAAGILVAACGPADQSGPQGQPTGPTLHTPVPEQSGFPADPVLPTPQGPIETMPPAPVPSAMPTT
jgi:hypothetical protein